MVTGTRLRRADGMAEPTPVTTSAPLELQMFEPGSTIAEQLDALPQFFSTGTAQRGAPELAHASARGKRYETAASFLIAQFGNATTLARHTALNRRVLGAPPI